MSTLRVTAPDGVPEVRPGDDLAALLLAVADQVDGGLADGAEDRRRALELVAEVLDADHADLARAARSLAWSEDDPLVEQTSGHATRVRTTIDLNDHGAENGRVP